MASSIVVGLLFVACILSVAACGLDRTMTLRMAEELAERRRRASPIGNRIDVRLR